MKRRIFLNRLLTGASVVAVIPSVLSSPEDVKILNNEEKCKYAASLPELDEIELGECPLETGGIQKMYYTIIEDDSIPEHEVWDEAWRRLFEYGDVGPHHEIIVENIPPTREFVFMIK